MVLTSRLGSEVRLGVEEVSVAEGVNFGVTLGIIIMIKRYLTK